MFNHLREKFWILLDRAEEKNCTVKIPVCHRRHFRPLTQKMSNLQAVRLGGARTPLQPVGLNYACPFRDCVGRNRVEKQYVCLFTRAFLFILKSLIALALTRGSHGTSSFPSPPREPSAYSKRQWREFRRC